MDLWQADALRIANLVAGLGQALTPNQGLILLSIAALTALLVLRFAGSAVGIPDISTLRRTFALGIGLAIVLAAEIAADLYLLPWVRDAFLRRALIVGAPALAALVVALPVMGGILKGKYFATLFAVTAAVSAALLMLLLGNAVLGSLRGESKGFDAIREGIRQRGLNADR